MRGRRGGAWTLALVVALSWTLVACSGSGGDPGAAPAPEPPPTTTTITPSTSSTNRADVDAMILRTMSYASVPGALVSVSVPGHVNWTRGFGPADLATGAPMDREMSFRIGGITSMYTCTLLYKLAQDEQLSVDDSMAQIVEGAPDITLAQLCQSTTGIPDYWQNPSFVERVAEDPTRAYDPMQLVSYASSSYPSAPRGTWYPSSTNAVLVGVAIETVTQKPLAESMQEWIFGPMRLAATSYPAASRVALPEPSPVGYWQPTPESVLMDYSALSPSVGAGSGAIVSNIDDLNRFVASVGEGLHVGRELTNRMHQTVPMGPDAPEWLRYGAGFVEMGPLLAGAGSIPGFAVGTVFDRDTGSSFTVVFNNSTGGGEYPMFLAAALAASLIPDSARLPFTAQEAASLAIPPERR